MLSQTNQLTISKIEHKPNISDAATPVWFFLQLKLYETVDWYIARGKWNLMETHVEMHSPASCELMYLDLSS